MKPHLWKAALSAVCLTAGLLVPAAGGQPVARLILLVAAYLIVGLEILIKAVKSIRQGQVFNEFFLMTVATWPPMSRSSSSSRDARTDAPSSRLATRSRRAPWRRHTL